MELHCTDEDENHASHVDDRSNRPVNKGTNSFDWSNSIDRHRFDKELDGTDEDEDQAGHVDDRGNRPVNK